ncbi:P-loop containing nucleoside triphosphate hydrolase protein [Corynespora cassiicola Philippines]|uniref:P-loop containing nucleoside triphosphate hydrolase protein n=1 Tax=Corynespora cassiicola Philippines TaxID=1448308 RepID=A0A2T2NFC3_CORCC|nr:P-loop containing nucleoside triphosphate hydrolase protein [Corynespora cassiicola Philippines]
MSVDDYFIPIMGMTGAGKSTFVSLCTEKPAGFVGHGLFSCTSGMSIHTMKHEGHTVHLIDTPGFDDSRKSDGETLQELAFWLAAAHEMKIRLSGIIYLHRITDPRMQGSASRAMETFKCMCGKENYASIVVATTRWDDVAPDELDLAWNRQKELRERTWADVKEKGGKIRRLSMPKLHAIEIIDNMVKEGRRITLAFQIQLVEKSLPICGTDAGKILFDYFMNMREKFEEAMEKAISEFEVALGAQEEIDWGEMMINTRKQLASLEHDIERTRRKMTDFRGEWEEIIKRDECIIQEAYEANREQIQEHSTQLEDFRTIKAALHASSNVGICDEDSLDISDMVCPDYLLSHNAASEISEREIYLKGRIERLEAEGQGIMSRKRRGIETEYLTQNGLHTRRNTTIGVVGAALGAGQLIAAMACAVM